MVHNIHTNNKIDTFTYFGVVAEFLQNGPHDLLDASASATTPCPHCTSQQRHDSGHGDDDHHDRNEEGQSHDTLSHWRESERERERNGDLSVQFVATCTAVNYPVVAIDLVPFSR